MAEVHQYSNAKNHMLPCPGLGPSRVPMIGDRDQDLIKYDGSKTLTPYLVSSTKMRGEVDCACGFDTPFDHQLQ